MNNNIWNTTLSKAERKMNVEAEVAEVEMCQFSITDALVMVNQTGAA